MAVIKNEKTGCWEVRIYYKDILGNRKQKTKRGFAKKSEALDWERSFKLQQDNDLNMSFEDFYKIYLEDISARIKENSTNSKVIVVEKKILPFFGKKPINSIKPADVRKWQTELLNMRKSNGEKYSPTYIKTIHAQLSAIFNHAVDFYGLSSNPARKAGTIGKEESKEMLFWTQDEYQQFIEQIADKPQFYYAFEMLYWAGIRCGDDDDKIRLNQRKPSKYKGLSRFGPEKNLQRINKFMKERPTFYKKLIQMKENFRFYLRCFYCITKVVILQFNSEKQDRISS